MDKVLDLYIQKEENEQGSFEMTLAAEVVERARNNVYGVSQPSIETHELMAGKIAELVPPTTPVPEVQEPVSPGSKCCTLDVIRYSNTATNWWLALIAFLLFMILCNMGE